MRASGIERSVEIAAPVEEVFAFHLDTRNAAQIAPRGQRVVGVEGVFPVAAGAVVVMRMRHPPLPLTFTWRVRIEIVEAPRRIVDVAERSPFAAWRHEHIFQPLGPGRTLMTDRVDYRLPGGPVGRAVGRLVVRPLLARAFAARQARTRELLERRG